MEGGDDGPDLARPAPADREVSAGERGLWREAFADVNRNLWYWRSRVEGVVLHARLKEGNEPSDYLLSMGPLEDPDWPPDTWRIRAVGCEPGLQVRMKLPPLSWMAWTTGWQA